MIINPQRRQMGAKTVAATRNPVQPQNRPQNGPEKAASPRSHEKGALRGRLLK